jgi:hypothetical protein
MKVARKIYYVTNKSVLAMYQIYWLLLTQSVKCKHREVLEIRDVRV